jgi:hypothetical protein
MDYLSAYQTECQEWLVKHGWSRYDGDMWMRNDDTSQSFNWMYLVVHRFIGKMPCRKLPNKRKSTLKRGTINYIKKDKLCKRN